MASMTLNFGSKLDRLEEVNAAEWDEYPEEQGSAEDQEIMPTPTDVLGSNKIEAREVYNTVNAVTPALPTHSYALTEEPSKAAKKVTCWQFWATPHKECRFTAEECRYLHAFLPPMLGEAASEASSDTTDTASRYSQISSSSSHTYQDSVFVPQINNILKERAQTCRFWANGGKCRYTAKGCKYLHEQTYIKDSENWVTGKLIDLVSVTNLQNVETSPKIEGCEYLASYNWLDHPDYPTILVPGSPPLWSPSLHKKQLAEDSGTYFRDANAARYPSYPTEPSFRALLAMHPDIDLSSFNIVGCGSTFGNLLRFCARINADFRFHIDRVKDTIFLIRQESSRTALITNVSGYGHSFPEAHTVWESDVKGSTSHQRIIKYNFGGMKFLVRSESDGYLKEQATLDLTPESETKLEKEQEEIQADMTVLLESMKITEKPLSTTSSIHIELRGRRIPQTAIFDLKTRAKETLRPIDMEEVFRRLWVNQTPYFIFAEHFRGSFEPHKIHPVSISDGLSKWEKDREDLLKRYQAVLMKIIEVARNSAIGKLQIIRRGNGSLEIRERMAGDDADVLPQDLHSKW